MPQSLSNVIVHLVFSTKDRRPFLDQRDIRDEMHSVLGGTSKTLGCHPLIAGGVADHIHLLANQSKTISLSDWVKELKRVTSIWIKGKGPRYNDLFWQAGYGAFSVSYSMVDKVTDYIRRQEEHHQEQDFQTEFRKLLERHCIEYDEKYVWD